MKIPLLLRHPCLALLLALASCATVPINRLPAYERAVSIAPVGETRVLFRDETSPTALPSMVPYATVSMDFGSDRMYAAREIAKCAKDLRPDVILLGDGGTHYAGSVGFGSSSWGYGGAFASGFSAPVYVQRMVGACYRLLPVRLGIRWDDTGMVTELTDTARASGILEGDRIVSIYGCQVMFGRDAPKGGYDQSLFDAHPGDEVPLVWIRPGTGRMEGKAVLQPNPPDHLALPGVDLTPPPNTGPY